mgnify:CR=1 FL=1
MWVHFIIFMTAFGTVLVWKAGWLRLDGIADKESLRLFLIVAVCGNLAGMAMTLTNGDSEIYQKGHRIEKSEDGAYTEELQVFVGDGKPEKVAVQIPEKETEETTQKNTGSADIWKLCTIVLAGGLGIGAVVVYLKYGRKKEDGFVSEQLEFTDGPFINEEQENEDGQED